MKCSIVQHRLLSMTHPERVPANLRAHLVECAACREWRAQLLLLERHVRLLPIPASRGKSKLMRRLSPETNASRRPANTATITHSSARTLPACRAATNQRFRTRLLAVAAILLLIALGGLGLQSWLDPAR